MAACADREDAQLPASAAPASALDTNSTRGIQLLSPPSLGPHLKQLLYLKKKLFEGITGLKV